MESISVSWDMLCSVERMEPGGQRKMRESKLDRNWKTRILDNSSIFSKFENTRITALFLFSKLDILYVDQGLPVEHRQEELQDIQAEGGHSPPCWGRRVPDTAAVAVASAAAEAAAAEGDLLLLAVAAVQ